MTELLVLRLVHVLGGIFWVGAGMFTAFFLMPTLAGAGPAAGAVMAGLQQRRLFVVLPAVALVTMASGLRLLWLASGGLQGAYFATATGATFAASGIAAALAFTLSLLVVRPLLTRAGALPPGDARAARMRAVGTRASQAAYVLLIGSAAGMALARYLR